MKSTESRFRVYDAAGEYTQSYNGALAGALGWAKDCAKSVKGTVLQFPLFETVPPTAGKLVFDAAK